MVCLWIELHKDFERDIKCVAETLANLIHFSILPKQKLTFTPA